MTQTFFSHLLHGYPANSRRFSNSASALCRFAAEQPLINMIPLSGVTQESCSVEPFP